MPRKPRAVIRVYEGIEFEIIPLDSFRSGAVSTTSALIATRITVEEEEHVERVAHAKHARSFVKRPGGYPLKKPIP